MWYNKLTGDAMNGGSSRNIVEHPSPGAILLHSPRQSSFNRNHFSNNKIRKKRNRVPIKSRPDIKDNTTTERPEPSEGKRLTAWLPSPNSPLLILSSLSFTPALCLTYSRTIYLREDILSHLFSYWINRAFLSIQRRYLFVGVILNRSYPSTSTLYQERT